MKIYRIVLTVVAFCLLCTSVVTLSMGWLTNVWPAAPALPFSAGSTLDYTFHKITFAKNSSTPIVQTSTEQNPLGIGTDPSAFATQDGINGALTLTNLQFGTITNLYFLENDNYVFYAVEIPYALGTEVHAAVSYGDYSAETNTFGNHFTIYKEQENEDGATNMVAITDTDKITAVKAIETTHGSTFLSYACALSAQEPDEITYETLNAMFDNNTLTKFKNDDGSAKMLPLATMTKNGNTYTATMNSAEDAIGIFEPDEGTTPDHYYLYIKLQPNMELYKYFIDYLYADMPFYLAYQVGIQLSVKPATTSATN